LGDHILSGHGMSIGEQAVESPTGEGSATHRAERPEGQRVINTILKIARRVSVRFDPMGMIPARKWPLQLAVAKLPTGYIIPVFGNPGPRKRTDPQAQDDPRAILNPPTPLHDLDRLPGGRQTLKSPRTRVPGKDLLGRGRNAGTTGENRHGMKIGMA